jgi:hypothetical protein
VWVPSRLPRPVADWDLGEIVAPSDTMAISFNLFGRGARTDSIDREVTCYDYQTDLQQVPPRNRSQVAADFERVVHSGFERIRRTKRAFQYR